MTPQQEVEHNWANATPEQAARRICATPDCGTDISGRRHNAKYCVPCGEARKKASRKSWWRGLKDRDPEKHARLREKKRLYLTRRRKDPVLYAQDKASERAWKRRQYAENPEWREAHLADGRARHSLRKIKLREALLARDGDVCSWCGAPLEAPLDGDATHVDHKHPRSLGGGNGRDNLQLLHAACNLEKGARAAW